MTKKRREAINEFALNVRHHCNVGDDKVQPDLDHIVEKILKGRIENDGFAYAASGLVKKEGDSFLIRINQNDTPERRRFTIAHELGHLFIHMGYLNDAALWEKAIEHDELAYHRAGFSEEEYDANEFAGAFLMPSKLYKTVMDASRLPNGTIDVGQMANMFGLSIDAIITRGRWLGILAW